MSSLALSFHDVNFNPVTQPDNQIWLTSRELGQALGYAREDSVNKIYERNVDEFTEKMTCNVKLTLQGQARETRIFSLRGCHLIAMFARTAIAKQFRKWVLDILDKEVQKPATNDHDLINQTLNQISNGNRKLYMSMYNGLTRRFKVSRLGDIPTIDINKAIAVAYELALEWHNKNKPTTLKLNDGEHYFVVKDGVVLWEKKLKPNCDDLPSNALKNPALMLEHIRQVVGEFVGKEALTAPKPLIISLPRETARHTQSGANLFSLNILQRAYGVQGNPLAQLFELLATAEQHHQPIIIKDIEGAKAIYDITKELAHQSQYALEMIAQTANKFCSGGSYFGNF